MTHAIHISLIVIASTIFISYIKIIYQFKLGWKNIPEFKGTTEISKIKLSCIIPFRNEEENLENIVNSLKNQSYPNSQYEIIFVDDHSTDHSAFILRELIATSINYKLITSFGQGKKKAIASGIKKAQYDYIVTTDADCIFSVNWLQTIAEYLNQYSPDLLVGPVSLIGSNDFFSQFQVIEFLSLISSGAGAIGINKSIMCNGANLIVKKEVLKEAQYTINNTFFSGDDIFLLQFCKANKKEIAFLKSKTAIVTTSTAKSLTHFFNQRVRWTTKSKGYTDIFTLLVAWLVFLSNIFTISVPILLIFCPVIGSCLMLLVLLKFAIDYLFLKQTAPFFSIQLSFTKFISVQLVYPIYIVLTVFWSIFGKANWKNRKIK